MASKNFNPLDFIFQMESDIRSGLRRNAQHAMRSVYFHPAVDIYETTTHLLIKVELAGIKPDRLSITLSADDRTLMLAGERTEMTDTCHDGIRCHQLEIYFGAFEREIDLPRDVHFDRERITANYRDGFLVLALPKQDQPRPETRTIAITSD